MTPLEILGYAADCDDAPKMQAALEAFAVLVAAGRDFRTYGTTSDLFQALDLVDTLEP